MRKRSRLIRRTISSCRRAPQRLEGEAIRDSMLAVSGLLDETMFGRGTRDESSRRRSIYFNIKRSQLIGSMVAFDAPEPLVSQGSRPTTTVAPQALMLMNSPAGARLGGGAGETDRSGWREWRGAGRSYRQGLLDLLRPCADARRIERRTGLHPTAGREL